MYANTNAGYKIVGVHLAKFNSRKVQIGEKVRIEKVQIKKLQIEKVQMKSTNERYKLKRYKLKRYTFFVYMPIECWL